jgi:hypothetical protein
VLESGDMSNAQSHNRAFPAPGGYRSYRNPRRHEGHGHGAMTPMDDHETASAAGEDSRRRFVRNLGVGSAVALGSAALPTALLADRASAGVPGAPTPDEPPEQPIPGDTGAQTGDAAQTGAPRAAFPDDDLALIQFLERLEWTLVAVYQAAIGTRILEAAEDPAGPQQTQMARTYQRHHREHARLLAAAQDRDDILDGEPDEDLLDEWEARVDAASTGDDVMQVLHELEESIAATYTAAIGQVETVAAAQPLASIQPIEGQHAVAWATELELPPEQYLPDFQTDDDAFDIDLTGLPVDEESESPDGTAAPGGGAG